MSVSWSLIAYTLASLVACGTLAVQGTLALRGHGTKVQVPAAVLALAAALLAGVFDCMRLGHLDRLFNVFGNPASPIARGYYAVVVLLVVAVLALVALHRSEEPGRMPVWCAALCVLTGAVGVYAVAASDTATIHSAAKAWLTCGYLLCPAVLSGVLACAAIGAVRERAAVAAAGALGAAGVAAALGGAAMSVVYALVSPTLGVRAASITSSTYGIVPGHPSGTAVSDLAATAGIGSPAFWVGVVLVGCALPLVGALAARKLRGFAAAAACVGALVCLLAGVACCLGLFLPSGGATKVFV